MLLSPLFPTCLSHLFRAGTRSSRHLTGAPCFVTTPIFYTNAEPHIGHLYSLLLADALQRLHRLRCPSGGTIFSAGTDEHGLKVQKAASAKSLEPQQFCDLTSPAFKRLASSFDVQYSRFIRTSEEEHKRVVQSLWEKIRQKGLIYKSKYEGWYCVSDEMFATNVEDVLIDGKMTKVSSESQSPVEWTVEENYMFRMSAFSEDVLMWLNKHPDVVQPKKFYDMVHKWVSHGLHDLSISRPRTRLDWGIPVPGDDSHTVYVWMDALFNYLTVAGYGRDEPMTWPPTYQVIGKDILKFHAVYWPAFLMAADLSPPHRILTHSHWTIGGWKMSKSKGNVVDPFDLLQPFGSEGVRYYLLREGILHEDGNFSAIQMKRSINSELSATLGNLLSRCCAPAVNVQQVVPASHGADSLVSSTRELVQELSELPAVCEKHFESGYFNRGIGDIMRVLRIANAFVSAEQPWTLVQENESDRLNACLLVALETVRVAAILLQPVVPTTSAKALNKLSVSCDERSWDDASKQFACRSARQLSPESAVLFQRLK